MEKEYRILGFPVVFDEPGPVIRFETPHTKIGFRESNSIEAVIRDIEEYILQLSDDIREFKHGVFHVRPEFKQTLDKAHSVVDPFASVAPKGAGSHEYLKLLEEMADLHRRKNAGYAGHSDDPWSNFRECEKFGVDCFTGVLVRMSDKWSRITSLVQNPANEQVGESIKDTLKDLAAYALIASILYDEHHDTD